MFVPWSVPDFGQKEKNAATRVIRSGWLTQGKETEAFERELSQYLGAPEVIALNNGTSALIASLYAHGIGPGDEVIVPSYTFIATVNSILAVGATPVLGDSDISSWDLTPKIARRLITKKTRAIMPVDVAGMPVDIAGFKTLCKEHKLILIEDSAQSIGAEYKGRRVGSFGHTSVFSFHMAKLVTTVEGGLVATDNRKIADKIRMIRNQGRSELYKFRKHGTEYHFDGFGLNMRFSDVYAAIGRVQLSKINKSLIYRKKIVDFYKGKLLDIFDFQNVPDYVTVHSNMIFPILVKHEKRDELNQKLYDAGISTRVTWQPAHLQKWHKKYFGKIKLKNAEEISSRVISIPLGNAMSISQAKYVVKVLKMIAR